MVLCFLWKYFFSLINPVVCLVSVVVDSKSNELSFNMRMLLSGRILSLQVLDSDVSSLQTSHGRPASASGGEIFSHTVLWVEFKTLNRVKIPSGV